MKRALLSSLRIVYCSLVCAMLCCAQGANPFIAPIIRLDTMVGTAISASIGLFVIGYTLTHIGGGRERLLALVIEVIVVLILLDNAQAIGSLFVA